MINDRDLRSFVSELTELCDAYGFVIVSHPPGDNGVCVADPDECGIDVADMVGDILENTETAK